MLVQRAPHLAVLPECRQRGRRHGVDGLGADQLLHVVGVGVLGVLGRGRRPQAALRARTRLLQRLPARARVELLPELVGQLRVVDADAAHQLVAALLAFQLRVDLAVHPADEEAGHAGHFRQVPARPLEIFEAAHERLHDLGVAVDRKDQRDVDVDAPAEHLPDRGQPGFGGRDLHHHIGPVAAVVQVLGHGDGLLGRTGHRGRDLDRDEAVGALGPVVDRPEDVGGGLNVLDHQLPEHLVRPLALAHQPDQGFVVVGRTGDGLLEDGRVGGDAGQALIAQARQLA